MSNRRAALRDRYNFVIAHGRIIVGLTYRGRIITAPVSIILGGIDHGRYVYTKDERKRIKTEPPDLSRIKLLNGRVEYLFATRNRNVLSRPRHEKRVVPWYPLRNQGKHRTPTKDFFGKPKFDGYWFKNDAIDRLAAIEEGHQSEVREWYKFLCNSASYKGTALPAEWQGANVGNASPTVRGAAPSREQLDRIARPSDPITTEQSFTLTDGSLHSFPLAVFPWGAHGKHRPWINRDAAEVKESAHRYSRRLDGAKKGYGDLLRWQGKNDYASDIT